MTKLFIGILKFTEKQLIPAAMSIIFALVVFYNTNEDNKYLVKLGREFYLLGAFLICFVLINILIDLFNFIKQISIKKYENCKKSKELKKQQERGKQQRIEQEKKLEEQAINLLWDFVDDLGTKDYECLTTFIKTNNTPIEVEDTIDFTSTLFKSNLVNKTKIKDADKELIDLPRDKSHNKEHTCIYLPMYNDVPAIYKFKLKEEVFITIKKSFEKYGRITHSERS